VGLIDRVADTVQVVEPGGVERQGVRASGRVIGLHPGGEALRLLPGRELARDVGASP
jgi:hypothetical protein